MDVGGKRGERRVCTRHERPRRDHYPDVSTRDLPLVIDLLPVVLRVLRYFDVVHWGFPLA